MSLQLVGKELLPNVYIKNIDVFDYSNDKYSAEVTLCVLDAIGNNGDMFWSDKELLSKNMNLLFVSCEDEVLIDRISKSYIPFNEHSIKNDPSAFRRMERINYGPNEQLTVVGQTNATPSNFQSILLSDQEIYN